MNDLRPNADRFSVLRVLTVAAPLLVIAAVVVQYTDAYRAAPSGDLGIFQSHVRGDPYYVPGVPSPTVFGLFVPVLLLGAAMPALRRRWPVTRGELVVVFCMLFVAVPILGAGFWHNFPGLQQELVRSRNLDHTMAVSPSLWPNHGNLIEGASCEDANEPLPGMTWTVEGTGEAAPIDSPDDVTGAGQCIRILHRERKDRTTLTLELHRASVARFVRPMVRYAICAWLRLDDPDSGTNAQLSAGLALDELTDLANVGTETRPSMTAWDRFIVRGSIDYQVPRTLDQRFFVRLTFSGSGTLYVRDFRIIDTEESFRYFEGYLEATPDIYDQLDDPDRSEVRVKPDGHWARWRYLLVGRVPWRAWAKPLALWGLLVAGSFLAMFCLVQIFYRQWEKRDRLTFPLQTFVLDLTRGGENGRLEIFYSMPFWIGLGLSAVYLSLQQWNTYYPEVPAVHLTLSIPDLLPTGPLKDATANMRRSLLIDVRPAFVAVAFFMSLEFSLSVVVFFGLGVLYKLVVFFTPLQHMHAGEGRYGTTHYPDTMLATGSLLFIALHCVFAASRHLVAVLRSVLGGLATPGSPGSPDTDDTRERRADRWSAAGLALSAVLIVGFALGAGLNPFFVAIYLLVYLLLALSAARIRAETGIPHQMILPFTPQLLLLSVGGTFFFGFRETLFTCQAAFLYLGAFLMLAPILAESMAAATRAEVPQVRMNCCLFAAFVLAIVIGGITCLFWAYTVGAEQMHPALVDSGSLYRQTVYNLQKDDVLINEHFRDHPDAEPVITAIKARRIAQPPRPLWITAAISFALTALLAVARVIWLGFPLHPLGFALAFTPAIQSLWPSIAVGHLVKRLGLRFGGVQLSRNVLRPFFVGLFVGDLLTVALWRVLESTVLYAGQGG